MKPIVSIIVLCWNHLDDLTKPFVENIFSLDAGISFELICLDNGSKDGTGEWLKKDKRIKTVIVPNNLGFGGGNNKALKTATGKYVLFMNNDVVINEPGWLKKLVDGSDNGRYVTGPELVTDNSATTIRHKSSEYLNGWCFLFPRSFLDEYDGFSPEFGWAYFEDVELCQRAIRHGLSLKKVPINIVHLGSKSSIDQLNIPVQFQYNQSVFRTLMFAHEKQDKKRIVFYCPGNYKFIDEDYEGKGVGGAEASLILLSRELVRLGWVVDIYNSTEIQGCFSGVNYNNIANFSANDFCDIFILFRNSYGGLKYINSPVKVFFSCDQHTTNDWEHYVIPFTDHTIAISDYHKQYLLSHYPFRSESIEVLDLGYNKNDYPDNPTKVDGKMIFCSVPMRGLSHLAKLFPRIKSKYPQANLTITSDYRLWGSTEQNQEFKDQFRNMEGVTFLGKIKREDLVKHQLESVVMAYPCIYDENFCISAIECQAAQATPVTTNIGAMKQTVGECGYVLEGRPGEGKYDDDFIDIVVGILSGQKDRLYNKERLSRYSWEYLAKNKYSPLFNSWIEKHMREFKANYCTHCKESFDNSYEFFKHRAEKHQVTSTNHFDTEVKKDLMVRIKTRRPIELMVNFDSWLGVKELVIPQKQSSDIIRLLTEQYGPGIVEDAEMII